MTAAEYIFVGLALAVAISYLAWRVRRGLRGGGCCGGACPVGSRKIRLAARDAHASTSKP